MATGGFDRSVDSRVVCSVCLEPYRGRQPKLLPCFHTFCLPCLSQLAQKNVQVTDAARHVTAEGDQETGGLSLTISCPTCRNIVTVPPGGVNDFQYNFYVDEDSGLTLNTPNPNSTQSAAMTTGAVPKGADLQAKVKTQVNVMEAVLARLSEEDGEITRQRRALDHSIQTRYATGLRHLADARDQSLVSLGDAAQAAHDKLEVKKTVAHSICTTLSQLADHEDTDGQFQSSPIFQAALLSDVSFRHYQQMSQKKGPKTYFSYSANDSITPYLIDSCTQFMGTVVSFGLGSDLTVGANKPPVASDLRDNITSLQAEVEKLQQTQMTNVSLNHQHDVTTLQADVEKLQMHVTSLETENARLLKEVRDLQGIMTAVQSDTSGAILLQDVKTLQADLQKVWQSVATLETGNARLIKGFQDLNTETKNSETQMVSLKGDMAIKERQIGALQNTVATLQSSLGKGAPAVAFHACIDAEHPYNLQSGEIIKYNGVETNVGGGYNPNNGIFTAPVRGVYIFMATVNPWDNTKRMIMISIAGNPRFFDGDTGYQCFESFAPCTGHVIVKLKQGQQVWMQSTDACCLGFDNNVAYFCGALLHVT